MKTNQNKDTLQVITATQTKFLTLEFDLITPTDCLLYYPK